MKTKLSNTSVTTYLDCAKKYDLHYNERLRPVKNKSALLFGSAIDEALNELLITKDINTALEAFTHRWTHSKINGILEDLRNSNNIEFTKKDHDSILGDTAWESLHNKGILMLKAYNKKVIPRIKKVIEVQKSISIKNEDGDEIAGALDLIIEWEDGKIYLMDNKTTSVKYSQTSPKESQQLVMYYYLEKDNNKLDGLGFITLDKNVNKNESKICNNCGYNDSGTRNKTCSNIVNNHRCAGSYNITYNPDINIDIIINTVDNSNIDEIMNRYDLANHGISNGEFEMNKKACFGKFGKCPYYDLCHKNKKEGLIRLEKRENS